jgi:YhgE/Pip-like protein
VSAEGSTSVDVLQVRAGQLLRLRAVWAVPLILASVVVAMMTAFYMASVVDPVDHLHALPVALVNEDSAITLGTQRLDIGYQVQAGLLKSPAVAGRLRLEVLTLPAAQRLMDRDGAYATVVVPSGFTVTTMAEAGFPVAGTRAGRSQIEILTSQRAGTLGVTLATAVLRPAIDTASQQLGRRLAALAGTRAATGAARALLADPIAVVTNQYRPLPANSALGASAFYLALLILMCGFLAGTIVHVSVDAALGYATTEFGPRWRQAQPLPISRLRTLLVKWTIGWAVTAATSGLMLAVAVGAVGTDAPHPVLLWLYSWLCSASVAAGTIVLFAVLGTPGQMVAILVFIYAGLDRNAE